MDFMTGLKRTMYCGQPRLADAGKEITVAGWVQRQRDLGALIFVQPISVTSLPTSSLPSCVQ